MVSLVCTLRHHRDDVNWCAFSAKLLATCSTDKTIRVYSTEDLSELPFSPLEGHGYGVHCCSFSACGEYLVSCSTDGTAVVWAMCSGEIEAVLEHPGRSAVRVCALSPDSSHLVSGAADGSLALWDFAARTAIRKGGVADTTIMACSFSPCGQLFATGSTYGDLRVWDLDLTQRHAEKNAHDLGVTCCHFSPHTQSDGPVVQYQLASCGQDSLLKIWIVSMQALSGCKVQLVHTLSDQSAPVLSCAFSSDGQMLVSGSVDKTVAVHQAHGGTLLYTLKHHERYVTACAFSPTAPLMATGSMDKSVNIWKIEDGSSADGKSFHDEEVTASSALAAMRLPAHSRLLACDWSEEDVSAWLQEEGLGVLVDVLKANNIDGAELLSLSKDTLMSDLHIESVGLCRKLLRKVEELKAPAECVGVPDEYLCPITREIMKDPVIAADGYSYEREAIQSWMGRGRRSSPMTSLPLQTTLLTRNHSLRMAICRWTSSQ